MDARDGRCVDDRATTACAHRRNRVLDAQHRPAQQQRHAVIPYLNADGLERVGWAAISSVIARNIQSTERVDGERDGTRNIAFRRDIALCKPDHAGEAPLKRRAFVCLQVANHDPRSFGNEKFDHPQANA